MKANGSFLWNRLLSQILGLATGLAIVLACAPGTALAQARGTSPQKASADTGPAKNARAQGGGQQKGIKVHGDWTITLRNADGSVASRHEFQNALVDPGLLAKLLAHGGTAADWFVFVYGGVCQDVDGTGTQVCMIGERVLPFPGTSSNLVVTAPTAGPHANALVLEGSIKTSFAGPIVEVNTQLSICAPGGPFPCQFPVGGGTLTRKDTIPLNINVQAGQTIDVKVVISFS